MSKITYTLSLLLLILCSNIPNIHAQVVRNTLGPFSMFEDIIYQQKQEEILKYLADDLAEGRGTGTHGGMLAASFIKKKFIQYGVQPLNKYYYQPFLVDSLHARNVIGIIPSIVPSDKYIIIGAHYDNIGKLNGKVYNGADSNASGITALLNLTDMFAAMRKSGMGPAKNIIIVAFDAKQYSMAGSKYFVEHLPVPKKNITCMINFDQIGTSLEPLRMGKPNYLIVLGNNTLKRQHRDIISTCNRFFNVSLDLDFSFYGSDNFSELVYKLSDQYPFAEANIPALLFTSGFNKFTNKTTDDYGIINYKALKLRTILAFYTIIRM